MTLRVRLVLALLGVLGVGLLLFGVATTTAFVRSQYTQLDEQLRGSVALVEAQLLGAPDRGDDGDGRRRDRGRPVVVAPGTYAEVRDAAGEVLGVLAVGNGANVPEVPDPLPPEGEIVTVGSAAGTGSWRLVVESAGAVPGGVVIAAVPTGETEESVRRLVVIEVAAGAVLLVLLATGSWLVLRRGLRPLETMAGAARRISAGDLSPRVHPPHPQDEVGQLGTALNTMLDRIEEAFAQRDATEAKLRQFLADASHELRTPLTSIGGFAELLRLSGEDPAFDHATVTRRIEEETARMRRLVDDLLLLARLDETRPIERAPVDLAVLAADACTDASAVDPTRPIRLDAPEPLVVAGDADQLRQAVGNLVVNALRHTPPGTAIEVSARRSGEHAILSVTDRGPGLEPDALAHVFDRFWQADRARAGAGAGLGLAIVAAIARSHGGVAEAANDAGGGARFTLTLPVRAAPPA